MLFSVGRAAATGQSKREDSYCSKMLSHAQQAQAEAHLGVVPHVANAHNYFWITLWVPPALKAYTPSKTSTKQHLVA